MGGEVNAVVGEVCFGKRKREVIVVAHIYKRVSQYKHGRDHLSLQDIISSQDEETDEGEAVTR